MSSKKKKKYSTKNNHEGCGVVHIHQALNNKKVLTHRITDTEAVQNSSVPIDVKSSCRQQNGPW